MYSRKKCEQLIEQGVIIDDVDTTYIDEESSIEKGARIRPNTIIEKSRISGRAVIGPNSRVENSKITGASIDNSVVLESEVAEGTNVGPFAYIRPGSSIGKNCKIGDFVEIKNSNIGEGTKTSHLAYIGDSDVGENVNIGCGVVFVNYDGVKKYRSRIMDGAFVGCNVNLVSPVVVGNRAYIAAGSTVVKDVQEGALYVERTKGKVIEGFSDKKGLKK